MPFCSTWIVLLSVCPLLASARVSCAAFQPQMLKEEAGDAVAHCQAVGKAQLMRATSRAGVGRGVPDPELAALRYTGTWSVFQWKLNKALSVHFTT